MIDWKHKPITWIFLFLLVSIIVAAVTYGNYQFARSSPGGTDFLVHWVGTRHFIIDHQTPYGDASALEIQTITYGRAALPGEHQLRVAYPLYSTLVFAPFALINDFTLARAVWMTFLEICLLGLAFVCMRLFEWKPAMVTFAIYIVFTLIWYKAVRGLINGNAVIIVALLIALSLWAIREKKDVMAGIFLAFMTIKPHVVVLFIAFVFIWAFSKSRWKLIGWTIGTVLGMVILGMLFIPEWLIQNIDEVLRYPGYNPAGTAGSAIREMLPGVGNSLSLGLTITTMVLLIYEWFSAWRGDYHKFIWGACITLVLSQLVGIQTDPGNFIILFVPLVYVFAELQIRWGSNGEWVAIILMVALLVGLWGLFLVTIQGNQQHPIMFLPLPFVLLLALYGLRNQMIEKVAQRQ